MATYSSLENPMDREESHGYSPWSHKESDMTEQLSTKQMYCFLTRWMNLTNIITGSNKPAIKECIQYDSIYMQF